MLNLILFGPPGSGKGTQAENIVDHYNLLHISTGDLFRYEMGNDTPLGLKAKTYISKGELVPDEVTIGMLKNKVNSSPDAKGFIFDGFPRTIAQAEALDEFLAEKDSTITVLVTLDVDDDEIVKRILNRGLTSGRVDDNDEEIIRNRIAVFNTETAQVYDYYAKENKSVKVDGLGTIEDIFDRIKTEIDNANS